MADYNMTHPECNLSAIYPQISLIYTKKPTQLNVNRVGFFVQPHLGGVEITICDNLWLNP